MMGKYPFFREEDEETLAVIGEEAAASDLEGTYQKPYAVLTRKRLYCKNEEGNFITESSALRSAGKGPLPGQNWFLWAVVACVSLTLVLLCFWYWFMGGKYYIHEIDYYAQGYIDNYQAQKEKVPEYEAQIKTYEEAQKVIEQRQKELEDMDYLQVKKEAQQLQAEDEMATEKLEETYQNAVNARDEQQRVILDIENYIADRKRAISDAETKIEKTDVSENNEIKAQIDSLQGSLDYWRKWKDAEDSDFGGFRHSKKVPQKFFADKTVIVYLFDGQEFEAPYLIRNYCSKKYEEVQEKLSWRLDSYVDIESLQSQIEWNQQYIADKEAALVEQQTYLEHSNEAVNTAKAELAAYQPKAKELQPKMEEIAKLEAEIVQEQSTLNRIPIAQLQNNIQRFEDSKTDYKNAKSVQRKVNLFLPCLLIFSVCSIVFIALTALKKTQTAVLAALVSAFVGLVCAFLSNINLKNIQGFGWGYYYIMPPPLTIILRFLPVLAVVLGALALWWNRKHTMYQIVHGTGAFNFVPSLYPAEEFKNFTEQVEGLKTEEAVHA